MTATVEFYWRPGCLFCAALEAALSQARIPMTLVNIWDDPDAAARVRSATGGAETVPTVFVADRALVNPSVDDVRRALRGAS